MKWIRNIPEGTVKDMKKTDIWKVEWVVGDPKKTSAIEVKQLKREGIVGLYEITIGENLQD